MHKWWRTWYGAPVALILCVFGFIAHPLRAIGEFVTYSNIDKRSDFHPGRWTAIVRACTDIDMCV
ncbi:MAG: hypothetical protein V1690_02185 [Candidatus Moraniibacteriota bacterium]